MRSRLKIVTGLSLALLAAPLAVLAQSGALKGPLTSARNAWPAPVAKTEPEVPKILTPAEELKTFAMPPGFHLELVAAEPLTKDPIIAEFDGDGRLWVLEMHGFAINEKIENSFEPINDLVVLEDTNNDGVYDKRTVFLDKLIMPRALKVLDKNCALVGEPPNLWKACDTNGDLKSDTKTLLDKTFSTQGVVEHGANGLYWGMDNTLVVSEHTWNARLIGDKFTLEPVLNRGQWGVTQDNGGRIYRNVNTDPLFVDYVAARYYSRNPNLVRTNGLYESLVKQEDTLIWPSHPTRGVNRGYREDIFRPDGSATYYGGVSSPMIYRGDKLPKEMQGQPFVVDGPTNIVHLLNLKNDNGNLSATDFYKKGEFLTSTDIRFRPVWLTPGYDGSFLIVDMYRGVSQDGPIQTDYLRDFTAKKKLTVGINYGRLYRVVRDGMPAGRKPHMSTETGAQLAAHLSDPNGWWRDTAQQIIVQRQDKSAVPALNQLAASAPADYTRLQALWTLDGLGAVQPEQVLKALNDPSPDVRAAALRLSEHWLASSKPMQDAVLAKSGDTNWFVRRQLAATLGELPAGQRVQPLLQVLTRYGDDPITADIAVSGLDGQEAEVLALLLKQPNPAPDAILALAGATSKRRDPATVQTLLAVAGDTGQPAAVRTAMLAGLRLGLQGGRNTQNQAVAGGRAGAAAPGVQRAGPSVELVTLPSAPTTLTTAAGLTGPLADAAKQVIALVNWPGKPAAPAVAPRTAEEERRFAAGKTIFAEQCAACHQANGEGAEHVGAKLVGSPWVNGQVDPLVRILTNGKEGDVGLMPPIGQALDDEQLASVLTFIRGSWGNASPPVAPPAVKETRQAYAHRTTPWTNAELSERRR